MYAPGVHVRDDYTRRTSCGDSMCTKHMASSRLHRIQAAGSSQFICTMRSPFKCSARVAVANHFLLTGGAAGHTSATVRRWHPVLARSATAPQFLRSLRAAIRRIVVALQVGFDCHSIGAIQADRVRTHGLRLNRVRLTPETEHVCQQSLHFEVCQLSKLHQLRTFATATAVYRKRQRPRGLSAPRSPCKISILHVSGVCLRCGTTLDVRCAASDILKHL